MKTNRILSALLAALMLATTLLSCMVFPASAADETPAIVTDGLVSYYKGEGNSADATVWKDSVGNNDLPITKDDKNYFTDEGLRLEIAMHYFPQPIVDLINGQAFTVEILLGDFVSLGSDFNTFLNSSGDEIALFRRNSEDVLELKTTGNGRIKIKGCLELLQNSLITLTYSRSGKACIYVNGELMGELNTAAGSLGASDLFIGHTAANKAFDTTYRSVRFYDRALTAEEVMANAVVDGVVAE